MKHATILIAFIALSSSLRAQVNLVPNPGFESYTNCPTGFSDVLYNDISFPFVQNWFSATQFGTPDYFNACAPYGTSVSVPHTLFWGYNPTRHCSGMCGLFTYLEGSEYREYIEVKLTEPLEAGENYYVEFYVSPVEFQNAGGGYYDFILAIDELGAYLSSEKIMVPLSSLPLTVEPQIQNIEGNFLSDSSQWYKISGYYPAEGGEQYLTIGNFKDNDQTNFIFMNGAFHIPGVTMAGYVFIDDILVTSGAIVPEEIPFCEGSTADITAAEGETFLWNTGDTSQIISVGSEGDYTVMVSSGCDTAEYYFHAYGVPRELHTTAMDTNICLSAFPLVLSADSAFEAYLWSTGDTLVSVSIGAPGTYWVSETKMCIEQIDSFLISALDPSGITVNLGNDTLICTNDSWQMQLSIDEEFDSYSWNTGDNAESIIVTDEGLYTLTVENICGIWSDSILISAAPLLYKPELGPDITLCAAEEITTASFTADQQDCSYLWNTGETDESIIVNIPGRYIISCKNICGIVNDTVYVFACENIFMPNAFSPNGDGINDLFMPITYDGAVILSFSIYDRWGEVIFETNNRNTGWDGTWKNKLMPVGSYTYMVQYDQAGYTQQQQGSFSLIH